MVPTSLGEFAATRVLAVSDVLAWLLGTGKMPAFNLFVPAVSRLCDWPPREAAANVLQYCAC
jgi:hypothetical protein